MSDALAIAAVTSTLQHLLQRGFRDDGVNVLVTTRPPDKVQPGASVHQVNLFLYQANIDPSWRNMDVPWQTKSGETKPTPLPLDLHYLLTVYYGDAEEGVDTSSNSTLLQGSHRLLGQAMRILYDHPILHADEINQAVPASEREKHPYGQVERVRITPLPLTLDELSKVWTGFQTQYRLSTAYEVSVVLIESERPATTPLPVLRRGAEDEGVTSLLGPFPTLLEIRRPPGERPGIRLGDLIEILGQNLGGDTLRVRFTHTRQPTPNELAPLAGSTPTNLPVQLPSPDDALAQQSWPAGLYQVSLAVTKRAGDPGQTSNQLPLLLAPIVKPLESLNDEALFALDSAGALTLPITCTPSVLPKQGVAISVGAHQMAARPYTTPTDRLVFDGAIPVTDDFLVLRLRIDSVDSLAFQQVKGGLAYDPTQKIRLAPLIVQATPDPVEPDEERNIRLTVTCSQTIQPAQQVELVMGDQRFNPEPHPAPTSTLVFQMKVPGQEEVDSVIVQLKVAGIESPPARKTEQGYVLNPGRKVRLQWTTA